MYDKWKITLQKKVSVPEDPLDSLLLIVHNQVYFVASK